MSCIFVIVGICIRYFTCIYIHLISSITILLSSFLPTKKIKNLNNFLLSFAK